MTNDNDPNNMDATVIAATMALTRMAGWTIHKGAALVLSPAFWNFNYVPDAELLLVPTTISHAAMRLRTVGAVRQARSDALVISVGETLAGEPQIFASICMWSSIGAQWFGPHLPWLGQDGSIWLVADPRARMDDEPAFHLTATRLVIGNAPYANVPERSIRALPRGQRAWAQPTNLQSAIASGSIISTTRTGASDNFITMPASV